MLAQRSNHVCLCRADAADGSRVDCAILHNLSRLRTLQHSPHPYRVVLHGLEKGFVEKGMESSTRKKKFHEYYGCYVGEARWQKAQDETTQSDGPF